MAAEAAPPAASPPAPAPSAPAAMPAPAHATQSAKASPNLTAMMIARAQDASLTAATPSEEMRAMTQLIEAAVKDMTALYESLQRMTSASEVKVYEAAARDAKVSTRWRRSSIARWSILRSRRR